MFTISPPRLEASASAARLSAHVSKGNDISGDLWFEVTGAGTGMIASRGEALVTAMLAEAARTGTDITYQGVLSERYLHDVNTGVAAVLQAHFGSPRRSRVHAAATDRCADLPEGTAVLSGFSGGIDSFHTVADHTRPETPAALRLTHLLYNDVGSHGAGADGTAIAARRVTAIETFAVQAGLPLIRVASNMGAFIDGPFNKTHTLRNQAVASLFQGHARSFVYSSGCPYSSTRVGGAPDTAYLDPVLLPLLRTERFESVLSGAHLTRVEKTARAAEIPATRALLDVCTRPVIAPRDMPNCGICWKCMRTQITLDALGVLDEFAAVFPLDRYRAFRKLYLVEVLASPDLLTREVADLLREREVRAGWRTRLAARVMPRRVAPNIARAFPHVRRHRHLLKAIDRML